MKYSACKEKPRSHILNFLRRLEFRTTTFLEVDLFTSSHALHSLHLRMETYFFKALRKGQDRLQEVNKTK